MDKAYQPQQFEDEIYARWEKSGYFTPDNLPQAAEREPFAVMMPPPNVTGVLHLGHALENTLLDAKIRFERMRGKRALLLPGTDHAAVATQARVEDLLKSGEYEVGGKKMQSDNPRQEFGREGLLELIRGYSEQSKSTILNQVRKMGTSADWSRLAYTFDDARGAAVNELFIRMYNDGLIYRGYRVVNWSVKGQSTCSDDELVYVERPATLYTFKYSHNFPITISSTRPETKLGDTAVAVHPEDKRYQQFIGQTFTVDVRAAQPLKITVIADENVDPDFGTGALGVTPAHSQIDYEMYQKNPEIGIIPVIGKDGRMLAGAGTEYEGLTIEEAREKFVAWLRTEDLLISADDTTQNAGTSDRFKDVVEAIPMEQWFVAVDKEIPGRGKTLKQLMLEAVTIGHKGDASQKVEIMPERFLNVYTHWIENLRDWNISRQIWWGHRIPAWYNGEQVMVQEEQPEGDEWTQDPDTLDTWFSSGAWTFSTLGWPQQTEDLKLYHPTSWMQMGHEILFFWMARMILMSTYALDQVPFNRVYIHGILRDKDGKKFSKSSGNGIDPLEVIAQYGTDALRMSLIKGITPGNDARFYEEKVADARNFVNKLWNVSRFVGMKGQESAAGESSLVDQWILSRLHTLIQELTEDFEQDRFGLIAEKLYAFLWNDFADWYVEMSKVSGIAAVQGRAVLDTYLRLLHPVAPFVTEVVAREMDFVTEDGMLMVSEWPQGDEQHMNPTLEARMSALQELVQDIRAVRAEQGIAPSQVLSCTFDSEITDEERKLVRHLARVESGTESGAADLVQVGNTTFTVQLIIEQANAEETKQKRIEELEADVERLESRLSNPSYADKAPAHLVEQTRGELAEKQRLLESLER